MTRQAKLKAQNNKLNLGQQMYKGVPLKICQTCSYENRNAIKFCINDTMQAIWIPKQHLFTDGSIRPDHDLDYLFKHDGLHKLELAHVYKHTIR